VRARLSYAKTIYFQPEIEIEPADPNLDEGGFDRLRREIEDAISDFGARLPVGEMIRRRRLEATLFGNPGVRNIGDIKMRTFVRDGEEAGDPRLVPETEDRERDAQRDWLLRPLETAVFDKSVKPSLITRMRPPIFRVALTIAVNTEDRRPTDDVRTAVREALDAYAGWLGKTQTSILKWENLATKLKEKAGVAELRGVTISDTTGLTVKLEPDGPRREYSLRPGARLELGSVEVVRSS
jgi:hypothetical protein